MNQHEDIILCIDTNETIQNQPNEKTPSISSLINNLGLINLASTLPEQHESRENGRLIDLCIITPPLLSSVHAFGYLPYDKITNTDHRPYFLDLQILELFAQSPDEATPIHTRKLKTNIPKRKEIYINNITKQFQKLNLNKAAINLQNAAISKGTWTNELQQKYDEIDTQATNAMLMSENKCSPTYPTIRAWSGKMREIGLKFRYWQIYFRHLTKTQIPNDTLQRSAQNASIIHSQKNKSTNIL
jgi:hypothetical protein